MSANAGNFAKIVIKHGPTAMKWISTAAELLVKNSQMVEWAKKQFEDISRRMQEVSKQHGDAAKTRGTLSVIRDVARALEANDPGKDETHADLWSQRADKIELRVQLAEALPRTPKKKALSDLKAEATSLLAALSDVTARAGTGLATNGSEGDPAQG
jgi:hypothetical protein